MKNPLLNVSNLGKCYRSYGSEWRRLASWFGFHPKVVHEVWTLQHLTFCLHAGEAIGIIGQNGAGKSTLLKMITGTLKATTGTLHRNGSIAAILELGMGFHPDLTGRQNAYNAGGLMGLTHARIDAVIEDIASFAQIGDYFDQPVRLYSSGMQVRVAFAIATAYRPDILIIDEALSVGDAYFQHKCFDRIKAYREQGTALLFVSHDKSAILALCDRAILLEKGCMLKEGNPEDVLDFYNALIAQQEEQSIEQRANEAGTIQTASGTKEAIIDSVGLYTEQGDCVELINVGERVALRINVTVIDPIPELVLGYMIKDRLGQELFGTNSFYHEQVLYNLIPKEQAEYVFTFDANLGEGSYSVTIALHAAHSHLNGNYEWRDKALLFSVANLSRKPFAGLCWIEPTLKVSHGSA